MGNYTKTITVDCSGCDKLSVDDKEQMLCNWGKTKKFLKPQKGKTKLECKLIKE